MQTSVEQHLEAPGRHRRRHNLLCYGELLLVRCFWLCVFAHTSSFLLHYILILLFYRIVRHSYDFSSHFPSLVTLVDDQWLMTAQRSVAMFIIIGNILKR